jgi:hypothetical protein
MRAILRSKYTAEGSQGKEVDLDAMLAAVRAALVSSNIEEVNIDIRKRRSGITFRVYPTLRALFRELRRWHKKPGGTDVERR